MTFFCPGCWSEVASADSRCSKCGADLATADAHSFGEKLRAALHHPEPQTAVRAAWILGERREAAAVPDLVQMLQTAADPFLTEAAAEALGKIGEASCLPALQRAARAGTVHVRNASKQAIERTRRQEAPHVSAEKTS
ncbi:MAG TPA: HEAT repeat domain-containing protein [Candidatus Nitrosotenuis sp.]|nr:HEAT repeat domain-containing protein [Candidatus Nitrosotenuis sp.]